MGSGRITTGNWVALASRDRLLAAFPGSELAAERLRQGLVLARLVVGLGRDAREALRRRGPGEDRDLDPMALEEGALQRVDGEGVGPEARWALGERDGSEGADQRLGGGRGDAQGGAQALPPLQGEGTVPPAVLGEASRDEPREEA